MRIRLSMGGKGLLPFNYNHLLAGVLYSAFRRADLELAHSVHVSKSIKLFTFSEIRGCKAVPGRGIEINDKAHFLVSSPRDDVIRAAVEGLLEKGEIRLGKLPLRLESMEVLKPPSFNGSSVRFRTFSPICVTTKREKDGRLLQWDLYPSDTQFYTNLRRNLIKKYELFHGCSPEDNELVVGAPTWTKPVRLKIKDTYHRASHMLFEARGAKELLEMGYEAGFGEKNSMGFGMVEVV